MHLVLASKSPRRRQLLAQFGLPFDVINVNVDECVLDHESPSEMTLRLAALKATTGLDLFADDVQILGGDTTVALDSAIMAKPTDRDEAIAMLRRLSGRTHTVFTAVALATKAGCQSLLSESSVTFCALSEDDIFKYCDTNDPYDKAGAYGIQGVAGKFVTRLDGSYTGVMGLPLWQVHQLIISIAKN